MIANGLTKAFLNTQKQNSFVKMINIIDQKDFLASIKRKKNIFHQQQLDLKYSKVYKFDANVSLYIPGYLY